jgi:TatD DNase family protein
MVHKRNGPTLIDTHCHLTFGDLAPQVATVLERARQAGVERVITVSTNAAEIAAALDILTQFPNVYLVAGLHPHEAGKITNDDLSALATLQRGQWPGAQDQRIVGIGETGLDFHYDFAPRPRQEEVFRTHLEIACQTQRPVVIHARLSEERACDIITEYPELAGRVVFHCYSAGTATTRRILDLGDFVSFTGVVTFKNAGEIRESARFVPLDRIMIETDAPYLSPEPVRKIRPNEPALLVYTARFIAELRGEPLEEFAAATTANAIKFFSLPEVAE